MTLSSPSPPVSGQSPAELDIAACDREPIHIPDAIQPHGLLLVFDRAGRELAAHAGDLDRWFPPDAQRKAALRALLEASPEAEGAFQARAGGGTVDVSVHVSGPWLVAEIEQADAQPPSAATALAAAQNFAARIAAGQSAEESCREAVDAVRALTGYDRVMAYRFDEAAGVVIAEARDPSLPTFLHQHFPGSDVPRQARALYVRNRVRVIPDVDYRPAHLVWESPPAEPLDMSDCVLRSVSPIHVQYLKNMAVGASASISIVVDGELWGLIACHHQAPRAIGYVERELCKHIGQLLSQQIAVRQRSRAHLETVRLAQKRDETLSLLAGLGPIGEALMRHAQDVARLLPADGVAILAGEEIVTAGVTPPRDRIAELADKAGVRARDGMFATDSLVQIWPEAADFAAQASGALFCDVRDESRLAFLWFRAEQVETVNWAGNPHKAVGQGDAGPLSPRKSFELWSEQVRHRSRPWSPAELASARAFGNGVAETIQQEKLQELNRQLRKTLSDREDLIAQKDLLIREVNHRVQNSLQLVNSMLYLQEKETDSDEVRTHFALARQRLTAVAMVHRRLWRTDKIGDVRLDTFLAELADELIQIWGDEWAGQVEVQADPVTLPTDKGIVLGLVLTELLTNAVKYAYRGAPGAIRLEARTTGRDELEVTVSDRGVGIKALGTRKSFGSKLIETLTRQLRGRLTTEDNRPGTRVTLGFPV